MENPFRNDFARGMALILGLSLFVAGIAYTLTTTGSLNSELLSRPTTEEFDARSGTATAANATGGAELHAEADVFTDITIVKIERDGANAWYETPTKERETLIKEIADHFGLDAATVGLVLDFEIENRVSRRDDRS